MKRLIILIAFVLTIVSTVSAESCKSAKAKADSAHDREHDKFVKDLLEYNAALTAFEKLPETERTSLKNIGHEPKSPMPKTFLELDNEAARLCNVERLHELEAFKTAFDAVKKLAAKVCPTLKEGDPAVYRESCEQVTVKAVAVAADTKNVSVASDVPKRKQ